MQTDKSWRKPLAYLICLDLLLAAGAGIFRVWPEPYNVSSLTVDVLPELMLLPCWFLLLLVAKDNRRYAFLVIAINLAARTAIELVPDLEVFGYGHAIYGAAFVALLTFGAAGVGSNLYDRRTKAASPGGLVVLRLVLLNFGLQLVGYLLLAVLFFGLSYTLPS